MTNAPHRIWATGWFLDPTCRWWSEKPLGENAAKTEYIRADKVAELLEAAKSLHDAFYSDGNVTERHCRACNAGVLLGGILAEWEARK